MATPSTHLMIRRKTGVEVETGSTSSVLLSTIRRDMRYEGGAENTWKIFILSLDLVSPGVVIGVGFLLPLELGGSMTTVSRSPSHPD